MLELKFNHVSKRGPRLYLFGMRNMTYTSVIHARRQKTQSALEMKYHMSKNVVEIIHARMPDDTYSCKRLNYNGGAFLCFISLKKMFFQ